MMSHRRIPSRHNVRTLAGWGASGDKAGESQVRCDLTLFGQFGRRGVGYVVAELIEQLRDIFRTNVRCNVIVVGAGELSHALLRYRGFAQRGFDLVAVFDTDPRKVGMKVGNHRP